MNLRKGSLRCNLPAETGVPRVINPGGLSQFCMSLFSLEAKGEEQEILLDWYSFTR